MKKSISFLFLALLITGCKGVSTSSTYSLSSLESIENTSSLVSSEASTSSVSSTVSSVSSSSVSSSKESISSINSSEVKYATWPTESVQRLCKILCPDSDEIIPSYDWASEIEINTDFLADELYFGIYCYVDSRESEQLYINKLKANNWKTSEEKIEGFYESYSPNGTLWLNFMYDKDYKDLEIYVSEAPITSWPERIINEKLQLLCEGTKTTIPSFEAELYTVNYYPQFMTLTINGYGVKDDITETYKNKITSLNWDVSKGAEKDDYNAISPAKDLFITFYYDEARNEFNIDVQKQKEQSTSWPTNDIAALVSSMKLTGTVMEYKGVFEKVEIDDLYYPPAVIVYVENGSQQKSADEYNRMLLDNGYVVAGKMYGEEIYNYPGTTLAYHATFLNGNCFTIELFDVSKLK